MTENELPAPIMSSPDRTDFADEYPFESHFLNIGEHQLHYVDEGEGEVLLFVHGNPTWSFAFRNAIKDLSHDYRCIALDHLGCGLSDKPQDYRYCLDQRIRDLTSLIKTLDLKNITFIAHDWGGAISMGTAIRNPERVSRFVLSNTAAFRSEWIAPSIHCLHLPLFGKFMIRGLNIFVRAALKWAAVEKPLTPAIKAGYKAPYGNWHDRVAVNQFVQDIPLKPSHPSYETLQEIEEGLPQFADHPIQFIWGEQDFCFTPKFLDRFEEIYPKANTLRLPDAGHYLFEDAEETYRSCIRKFLSENAL